MLIRLLRDFRTNSRAGIALMTACLMPLIMVMMFTANDFGRYYMYSRYFSSAAQQANDWMAQRTITSGKFDSSSANATAKEHFDMLIKSTGLASDSVTFAFDKTTNRSRLVAKGRYNLLVSKLLNVEPLPMIAEAGSYHPQPQSLFISIVFSSGEMRSEGDYIYGSQKDNTSIPNLGVSWSSDYYKDVIGKEVITRPTPTHNYYMVTALVKELIKSNQDKKLYINIIPVSATINLNPSDYSAAIPGTKEGKLPPWIYNDTGFNYDKIYNASSTSAICISNRTIPNAVSFYSYKAPEIVFDNDMRQYFISILAYQHDYLRFNENAMPASISKNSKNWFSHENLLMDSSLIYPLSSLYEKPVFGKSTDMSKNTRGYPSHSLEKLGNCPAINTIPALATFQRVTDLNYPKINTTNNAVVTENELFWDYMRNYIDPEQMSAASKGYAIWGSPNIALGLQVAYENIAYVQNSNKINNNDVSLSYDPANSSFQVYVVSDQIGGVKNAGGSPYITKPDTIYRLPYYNSCVNVNDTKEITKGILLNQLFCAPYIPYDDTYPYRILDSNMNGLGSTTPNPQFKFTHMWWDNSYNPVSGACAANSLIGSIPCDPLYSSTPASVVHNFYNIINYSIDIKYNKTGTNTYLRPLTYFIDTGSAKASDECIASNPYQKNFQLYDFYNYRSIDWQVRIPTLTDYTSKHYSDTKPCVAHAEMTGYDTNYNYASSASDTSMDKEGGIITMTMPQSSSKTPLSSYGTLLDRYTSVNISASGFDRVFAYKYSKPSTLTFERNIDVYANIYLPIYYYDSKNKLQLRSNDLDKSNYDATVNNTTNATNIVKEILKHLSDGPTITRPF